MMISKRRVAIAAMVVVLAGAAYALDRGLTGSGGPQSTNDAFVMADSSVVAPKIAGLIDQVTVDDNQPVHAGQVLAHIDDRDYQAALAIASAALSAAQARVADLQANLDRQQAMIRQAQATVQADQAATTFAQANAQRYRTLSQHGAGTVEQGQQADMQAQQASAIKQRDQAAAQAATQQTAVLQAQQAEAKAGVARAEADLQQARLNLSYTRIVAPLDGVVGERHVRVGNYVQAGSPLLVVVPMQAAYLVANFQETQLAGIRAGNKVRIVIDTYPDHRLSGWVDSVAPASGVAFSPIAPDNATGNFTKVVQRIPVKIRFDPNQGLQGRLRVGMSAEASIDTASSRNPAPTGSAADASQPLAAR